MLCEIYVVTMHSANSTATGKSGSVNLCFIQVCIS